MSEEVALAAADLALVESLRTERDAARADAAALYEAWCDLLRCPVCSGHGVHYVDIDGEAEPEPCEAYLELDNRLRAFDAGEHPGAALLAELDAARAVVAAARGDERAERLLRVVLAEYDRVTKNER